MDNSSPHASHPASAVLQPTVGSQQSTVNSQQSTVNSQQSTVNSRQSAVGGQSRSAVNSQQPTCSSTPSQSSQSRYPRQWWRRAQSYHKHRQNSSLPRPLLLLPASNKESPPQDREEPDSACRLTAVQYLAVAVMVAGGVTTTLSIGARAWVDLGGFPVDREETICGLLRFTL